MTTAIRPTAHATPSRRLTAAGIIGRRSGRTVQITRTESGTTGTVSMSAADVAAHEAASHVRLPKRIPGAVLKADQIEDAYAERAHQLAAFDQDAYRLAAGGDR